MKPLLMLLLACSGSDAPPGTDASSTSPPDGVATDSAEPTGDAAVAFVGTPPRNVLMISIDTLRADHVDPLGNLGLTPKLKVWLEEGVYGTDVMQCSNWTYASTSCTLLGRDNVEHGFLPRLEDRLETPYPDGEAFLATYFRDAGYRTAITSRNGFLGPRTNNIQGYDVVLESLRPAQTQLAGMLEHLKSTEDGSPFFAHVHVIEPHDPYTAPAEYEVGRDALEPTGFDFTDPDSVSELRRFHESLPPEELALAQAHARLVYEAEVRYLDDQIGTALQAWRAEGYLDDTLVVFWSDHGEQLWEHGRYTHAYDLFYGENDALFGLWADNIEPGVWPGPVSLQDLGPTVLRAVGLDVPPQMTGFPLGEAPPDRVRKAMVVARDQGQNVVRKGNLKLVFRWTTGEHFLFDRVADPEETTNLWDPMNPEHAALWGEMLPYVEATEALAPDVQVDWAAAVMP